MKRSLCVSVLALALLLSACAPVAGTADHSPAPADSPIPAGTPAPSEHRETLVPYVGKRIFDQWGYGEYYTRGLMTLEGEIVIPAVYSTAVPMAYWENRGAASGMVWRELPVYLLTQGVPDGGGTFTTERLGVSALDGSWQTGLTYTYYAAGEDGFLLADGTHIELWDFDGAILKEWSLAELGYLEDSPLVYNYSDRPSEGMSWQNGMLALEFDSQNNQMIYLNTDTGALLSVYGGYFRSFQDGLACWNLMDRIGYLDKDGEWAIPAQYRTAQGFFGGRALVQPTADSYALIDETGAALLSGDGYLYRMEGPGGAWYAEYIGDNTITAVYDGGLSPMDPPAVGQSGVFPGDADTLCWRADDGFHLWSPGIGEQVVPSRAEYMNLVHGLVWTSDQALYARDGKVVIPPGAYDEIPVRPLQDPVTGEPYLVAYREGGQDLLALDGTVLGTTDHRPSYDSEERQSIFLIGGLVESIGVDRVTYSDRAENVVYTHPLTPPEGRVPG